jgi:predicted metal-dependent HD superfamily phosphohydrolase
MRAWRWDPAVRERLVARYAEPRRRYHTLEHIRHCLREFDPAMARDPDSVELAIWYHDAVYDPRRSDNEERSAALLLAEFPEARRAADLVLVTKHHRPADPDAELLVDIDLAILGQRPERFDRYERRIREEYDWVPESVFREKRAALLRAFLRRRRIYRTPSFRSRYEAAARANLARSLASLAP